MPLEVLNKIKFLCRAIPKKEWSGVLFYRSFGEPYHHEFKVELVDILPMDMGTSTYTSYTYDESVVSHIIENNLEDCKIGHIHSHNTMGVFFSGTDISELEDNTPHHNYYLSLIVNNYMDFQAKVAFRGKATVDEVEYICKDGSGENYSIPGRPISKEVMFIIDCKITSPSEGLMVSEGFSERVKKIILEGEKKASELSKSFTNTASATPYTGTFSKPLSSGTTFGSKSVSFETEGIFPSSSKTSHIELWACNLLRFGSTVLNDSLDEALEDMENYIEGRVQGGTKLDPKETAQEIVEAYPALYDKFWNSPLGYDVDKLFLERLEGVTDTFLEYEGEYTFLSELIALLKRLKHNYEKEIKKNSFNGTI